MNQREKIVWGIVAVLCASQVFVLWSVFHSSQGSLILGQAHAGSPMPGDNAVSGDSAAAAALAGSRLVLVRGEVQAIDGQTLTLSTSKDGSVAVVRVTSATKIIKSDGSQKDPEVQKSDLAAYNAKAAELGKDPVGNKSALETLMLPNPFIERPIQLSDMQAGDSVTAFSFNRNSDGSYDARQIVVLVPSAEFQAAQ